MLTFLIYTVAVFSLGTIVGAIGTLQSLRNENRKNGHKLDINKWAGRDTAGSSVRGIIHMAGGFDPEDGQFCIVCGKLIMKGLEGVMFKNGSPTPKGWTEGNLIMIEGNMSADVTGDTAYLKEGLLCSEATGESLT